MNAKGLPVMLGGVSSALSMPFYESLVTQGAISRGEFDGTRHNLDAVIAILENTPEEKIESLVAEYDDVLTEHVEKVHASGGDLLGGFKHAQILEGYVTTIITKAGIKI
jgi:hypothetical protein